MQSLHRVAVYGDVLLSFVATPALCAQGEMGTGVPFFGIYSSATGIQTNVWAMTDIAVPFPSGCTFVTLTPTTMGIDSYKIAVATLLTAKTSGRRVRFVAHAARDTGCGIDYVEMQ